MRPRDLRKLAIGGLGISFSMDDGAIRDLLIIRLLRVMTSADYSIPRLQDLVFRDKVTRDSEKQNIKNRTLDKRES
jgi:hypothetical protein